MFDTARKRRAPWATWLAKDGPGSSMPTWTRIFDRGVQWPRFACYETPSPSVAICKCSKYEEGTCASCLDYAEQLKREAAAIRRSDPSQAELEFLRSLPKMCQGPNCSKTIEPGSIQEFLCNYCTQLAELLELQSYSFYPEGTGLRGSGDWDEAANGND